jgi:hypothetical protein
MHNRLHKLIKWNNSILKDPITIFIPMTTKMSCFCLTQTKCLFQTEMTLQDIKRRPKCSCSLSVLFFLPSKHPLTTDQLRRNDFFRWLDAQRATQLHKLVLVGCLLECLFHVTQTCCVSSLPSTLSLLTLAKLGQSLAYSIISI